VGSSLIRHRFHWQPLEPVVPHASRKPWLAPLRAMLDGTATIEAIASPVAINFFAFDI
jgi:hypothetical protein